MTNPSIQNKTLAVLTGDIVGSSTLSNARRLYLYEYLQSLSSMIQKSHPREVTLDMAKYRGDGWQLVVNAPEKAFEIALAIRLSIRSEFSAEKLDTRVAIAIGKADFIPERNISEGFGPVFTASGSVLDGLKEFRMGLAFAEARDALNSRLLAALIESYDTLITAWTPAQCQAVQFALQGLTQVEAAQRWQPQPIAQSAVSRHLKAARWDLICSGLQLFEDTIKTQGE